MAGLAGATTVEMVTVSEMARALESLGRTQFDVVVLGGLNGTTPTVYHAVRRVTPAPVVLLVDRAHTDWNELNMLDVAGYIAEQVGAPRSCWRVCRPFIAAVC